MVQSVLIFGSETWVVMNCNHRVKGNIHNWMELRISVRMYKQLHNRGWDKPPIGEALADAGHKVIGVYIT